MASSPGLLRSAYVLTGDRGLAEDLLQSALVRTVRRWDEIEGSPLAYTFAVLVNLSHDHRRAQRRRPVTVSEPSDWALADVPDARATGRFDALLDRDAIVRAAHHLPAAQREVLACRFLMDLSVSETALALGMAEGTVKSYSARALAGLRARLAADPVSPTGGPSEVSPC